ncbi:hypothetical protein CYMTET_50571 [Cymbomonas tetramitiformis]|uniref:Right handed beta helix domain-containing protein n=1 Tax=Cymbomonas tetramitiformis TaxID=36881 RepID=A0AAE0BP05_9CHLO|nr:hypothetical protein CYMTET_50571 [Cymbomonas tetramitiformis]
MSKFIVRILYFVFYQRTISTHPTVSVRQFNCSQYALDLGGACDVNGHSGRLEAWFTAAQRGEVYAARRLLSTGSAGSVTVTNPDTAFLELNASLSDPTINEILLWTNVSLDGPLPGIGHAVRISGNCTGTDARCHISGSGAYRHFSLLPGAAVQLEHLVLCQGANAGDGGALAARHSTVSAYNCALESNRAGGSGGAIYAIGSNVSLVRTSIIRNAAAVAAAVGAYNGSSLTLDASNVMDNDSEGDCGGIAVEASSTLLALSAVIAHNTGAARGGGACILNGSAAFIYGGEIASNAANYFGGLWLDGGSTARLQSALMLENHAVFGVGRGGGVLFMNSGSLIFHNGTALVENSAEAGGGIFVGGGPGRVLLDGGRLTGNLAFGGEGGGGLYADAWEGIIELMRTEMGNNSAPAGDGGGLWVNATVHLGTNSSVIFNLAGRYGGGLYAAAGAEIVATNESVVENNTAISGGGGVCLEAHGVLAVQGGSSISYNMAGLTRVDESHGGGVYAGANAKVMVSGLGTAISGNQAQAGGGGIFADYASVEVSDGAKVTGNDAGWSGGGIQSAGPGSEVLVAAGVVSFNSATWDGGGITASALRVARGSSLEANSALRGGGGLAVVGQIAGVYAEVVASSVSHNVGFAGGGVMVGRYAALVMEESSLCNNSAFGIGSRGGGIFAEQYSMLNISESNVTGNSASYFGGGVHLSQGSSALLVRLSCSANIAEYGGVYYSTNATIRVEHASLHSNVATIEGGALHVNGASAVSLVNSSVHHNLAQAGPGGGLVMRGNSVMVLEQGTRITSNAAFFGGGLYITESAATIGIGCALSGNKALFDGGGLAVYHGVLRLDGVAVRGCLSKGKGAGLIVVSSTLAVADSLFVECAGDYGGGMYSDLAVLRMQNSTLNGNAASIMGGGAYFSGGNVTVVGVAASWNFAAGRGGAMALDKGTLMAQGCTLENNRAGNGGGIQVFARGSLEVEDSRFLNSSADSDGGGLSAAADVASIRLRFSIFRGGWAAHGAGAFFEWPNRNTTLELHALEFSENSAHVTQAVNMYWLYVDDKFTVAPNCTGVCDWPKDTLLFCTDAVAYIIMNADGEEVVSLMSMSGSEMDDLRYIAMDYYHNPTMYLTDVRISAESPNRTVLLESSTAWYSEEAALFDSLVAYGQPGTSQLLDFNPSVAAWGTARITLTFVECQAGEQMQTEQGTPAICRACPEGYIKFDNSSVPCTSCADVQGLECLGNDRYNIEDGYWLSPSVLHCRDRTGVDDQGADQTVKCFFEKVYTCDAYHACTSSSRNASGLDARSAAASSIGGSQLDRRQPARSAAASSIGGSQLDQRQPARSAAASSIGSSQLDPQLALRTGCRGLWRSVEGLPSVKRISADGVIIEVVWRAGLRSRSLYAAHAVAPPPAIARPAEGHRARTQLAAAW